LIDRHESFNSAETNIDMFPLALEGYNLKIPHSREYQWHVKLLLKSFKCAKFY
jgi:hypothetical protein